MKSTALLTVTAFIWGMAFVAQRLGMDYVGPFLFNGLRMFLGAMTLGIVLLFTLLWRRRQKSMESGLQRTEVAALKTTHEYRPDRRVFIGGLASGLVLFAASNIQQVGMVYTTASKAGFLTTMYIVLVPILGLFLKQKTHWNTWVSVAISVVGLYLLSVTSDLTMQPGDLVVLMSALFWALHILVIDYFAPRLSRTDLLRLCATQFAIAGLLSIICIPLLDHLFVTHTLDMEVLIQVLPAILYAGILSTGVGFTLQAVAQRNANPAVAAIVMSLEAVFSVIGGIVLLNEVLSGRELLGCLLMFVAAVLAQMPLGSLTFKGPIQHE
ncbi:MAG: DMT family transporter [Coriobacteriaceae bacterium]|nr:DMT family transporter [Coriobacteriaceae bacterium]